MDATLRKAYLMKRVMKHVFLRIWLLGSLAFVTCSAMALPRPLLDDGPAAANPREPIAGKHDRHKKDKVKPDATDSSAPLPAYYGPKKRLAVSDLENKVIPKINELADRSGLAGRMVALGERNDVQDWMRRAVIYVQPSLEEALGLALQEAMFAGCACIGSRVGGIPELLTAEADGLLVAPGDVAGLAAALERLMTDAGLRQRLGAAARQTIEDRGMTRAAMIRQHIEIYESAYGERP